MKFFTVYKITNLISSKIYIGSHVTDDLNDTYMGSSKYLTKDIKELGIEKFKREWLFIFDNKKDMLDKEEELILFYFKEDKLNIYNKRSNIKWNATGYVAAKDIFGNVFHVNINDYRLKTGEFVGVNKGLISARFPNTTKHFLVDTTDTRLKTGELLYMWQGRKRTDKFKKRISEANAISQKGERNSSFGRPWIYNEELKQNKKISLEELDMYLNQGWKKGRKSIYNKKYA